MGDTRFLQNPVGNIFLIIYFILFLVRQRGRNSSTIYRLREIFAMVVIESFGRDDIDDVYGHTYGLYEGY